MRWPRFIATRQSKIGDVLFSAKDDPAGALAAYAQSLAGRRAMAAAFPDAEEWPLGMAYVEHQIAHVALFARRFEQAATAAREALSLNPKERMPESELAYALMFLGRTDEADRLFLGNRGKTFDGEPWESVVHDDFAELRAKGLIHPHMAEIERVFGRQDIVKAAAKP
jgi:predicted Zn-dependent protease